MKNLTVCTASRSIEVSKKFNTLASQYGTPEYNDLQAVRRDYPGYKVVVVANKTSKSNKPSYKGLTYEYMEAYITKHDDENSSIMEAYMTLRGISDDADEAFAESCSYFEIKAWFLNQYPAIAEFHKKREAILAKAIA